MKEDLESQLFRKVSLPLYPQLLKNSGQINQKGIQQKSTSLPLSPQNICSFCLKLLILISRPFTGHSYNKPFTLTQMPESGTSSSAITWPQCPKDPVLSLPLTQACSSGDQNPQVFAGRPYLWTSHTAWQGGWNAPCWGTEGAETGVGGVS